MSQAIILCYECGDECAVMPEREPLSESTTTVDNSTQWIDFRSNYLPTSKTYKCVNPKCWVTKIEVRWS